MNTAGPQNGSDKMERRRSRAEAVPQVSVPLPRPIAQALAGFLADNRTGNVQLNIHEGTILGCHVEQIVKATGR